MGIRIHPLVPCVLATAAGFAWQPDAEAATPAATRVRCESIEGRWKRCALPFAGEVQMLRQLSRNPCIRNQSWGRDAHGVWVSRGCRAEFGPEVDEARAEASTWRTLRCESRSGGRRTCPVETSAGVKLTRQLSRMDCELDKTWGYDADGVWVSRGCRAEFQVRNASLPGTRFFRRLFGRDDATADEGNGRRSVRCESIDGGRTECKLQQAAGVELVRQLSRATCVAERNWGWDPGRIWVDKGCRAEFMVR